MHQLGYEKEDWEQTRSIKDNVKALAGTESQIKLIMWPLLQGVRWRVHLASLSPTRKRKLGVPDLYKSPQQCFVYAPNIFWSCVSKAKMLESARRVQSFHRRGQESAYKIWSQADCSRHTLHSTWRCDVDVDVYIPSIDFEGHRKCVCVCVSCTHACVTEQILKVNKALKWEFSQCLRSSDSVPYCTRTQAHTHILIMVFCVCATGVVTILFTDEAALN